MRIRYSFSARHTGYIDMTNKHRVPIPKMVKEIIRTSDIILEVIDSRFIEDTRNKELEKMVIENDKKLIFVLNKVDLIDFKQLEQSGKLEELKPYVLVSTKTRMGIKDLRTRIKIEAKKIKLDKPKHIGIIGYPNTGKSSIINVIASGGRAPASAASGFTRGIKKIRLSKGVLLLDTPGVLPEKEAPAHTREHAKKLSVIGVKTFDRAKNPDLIVSELMRAHPGAFEKYYEIEANGDVEILVETLGKKNNWLSKGGQVDTNRTARMILKDWQFGKIKFK